MQTKKLTNPNIEQKEQLLDLWNKEYPVNLSYQTLQDFENYLLALQNPLHILLLDQENQIKGWAFAFDREHERWFALIIDSEIQKQGYGKKMLQLLQQEESILNGWVIDKQHYLKPNGQPYPSPLQFYLKQDFMMHPQERLEIPILSAVKISWKRPI